VPGLRTEGPADRVATQGFLLGFPSNCPVNASKGQSRRAIKGPLIARRPTIAKEGGNLFANEEYVLKKFPSSIPPTALSQSKTTYCIHLYDN